jgi:hypothetical protein
MEQNIVRWTHHNPALSASASVGCGIEEDGGLGKSKKQRGMGEKMGCMMGGWVQ